MGVPPRQSDWHLFVMLGISSPTFEQGETKTSPGCDSTSDAVLQSIKSLRFGFEGQIRLESRKIFP